MTFCPRKSFSLMPLFSSCSQLIVLRVSALIVNVGILVYLVYAKRLFGVRGGQAALHDQIDWTSILSPPVAPDTQPPHATPTL